MSAAQLSALRAVVPSAEPLQEGGRLLAFLPGLKVETQGGAVVCDALLHPHGHTGYQTRLFLDRQILGGSANNWTAHSLGGRTWWACSWQGVEAALPWVQILMNHLRAFR